MERQFIFKIAANTFCLMESPVGFYVQYYNTGYLFMAVGVCVEPGTHFRQKWSYLHVLLSSKLSRTMSKYVYEYLKMVPNCTQTWLELRLFLLLSVVIIQTIITLARHTTYMELPIRSKPTQSQPWSSRLLTRTFLYFAVTYWLLISNKHVYVQKRIIFYAFNCENKIAYIFITSQEN